MKQGKIEPITKTWLSAREARAYLDCSDDFLQTLRDEARVSFSRVGGKYFYNLESIDRLLIKNKII
jgi:hypothetical protein